jgi:hypothetical protein
MIKRGSMDWNAYERQVENLLLDDYLDSLDGRERADKDLWCDPGECADRGVRSCYGCKWDR